MQPLKSPQVSDSPCISPKNSDLSERGKQKTSLIIGSLIACHRTYMSSFFFFIDRTRNCLKHLLITLAFINLGLVPQICRVCQQNNGSSDYVSTALTERVSKSVLRKSFFLKFIFVHYFSISWPWEDGLLGYLAKYAYLSYLILLENNILVYSWIVQHLSIIIRDLWKKHMYRTYTFFHVLF